jgi:hypothetical protein
MEHGQEAVEYRITGSAIDHKGDRTAEEAEMESALVTKLVPLGSREVGAGQLINRGHGSQEDLVEREVSSVLESLEDSGEIYGALGGASLLAGLLINGLIIVIAWLWLRIVDSILVVI